MNKKKKNGHAPGLRFPEFHRDEVWKKRELGQISEIVRGGSPRPIEDYITSSGEGLNWLKIADVPSDAKYITHTKEKVLLSALKNTREVEPGDLILSNSMSFGRPYILEIKSCIHDGWIAIRKISDESFEDFLYYVISSESSQAYFHSKAAGAAVKNLNAEIIKKLPIFLPNDKKEQQKIADCLSSIDETIYLEKEKLDQLKDHKNGLFQNLLSRDGQNLPKYRLKQRQKSKWEKRNLGDIAKFINGRAYQQDELLSNGKYRVLRVGNFFTNNDWYYSNLELDQDKYCEKGDLLYAWSASFGPHLWEEEKVIYHYHIWKVINRENVDRQFLFYILDYETEKLKSKSLNGFALMHITKGTIEKWNVLIPKKIDEQQKIASCLSSLDNLITAQTKKIELLEQHKKGLMQGLFPKIN